MKNRIISFVLALTLIVSALLGTTVFASAEGAAEYKNTALNLAENVTVKIQVAIAAPAEGDYAKASIGDKVLATTPVADLERLGDDYVIDAEVAVKDFAKDVKFEICSADGTAYFEKVTSAKAYADKYKEGEFAGLLAALEVYAAAAAAYFDGGEAVTVDADIPAKEAQFGGTLPAGLTHRGATLVLESETTVRHYFVLAEGKLIENYKFFLDLDKDGALDANEALTANKKTNADGDVVYYVDIDGITPNELDIDYTVGAYGVADGVTYTCTYGALTYAASKANANAKLANLVKALYNYNKEASLLTGTVTFDDGETMTYKYGVETPIVYVPTNAGSDFIGWYDANGIKYDTVPASATDKLELVAKYATSHGSVLYDASAQKSASRYFCLDHVVDETKTTDGKCDLCGKAEGACTTTHERKTTPDTLCDVCSKASNKCTCGAGKFVDVTTDGYCDTCGYKTCVADHEFVDEINRDCKNCSYCVGYDSCVIGGNMLKRNQSCPACGNAHIGAKGTTMAGIPTSASDKGYGYAEKITVDGKEVMLWGAMGGTFYNGYGTNLATTIKPGTSKIYAFSMELGIPSQAIYGEYEKNASHTIPNHTPQFYFRTFSFEGGTTSGAKTEMSTFYLTTDGYVSFASTGKTGYKVPTDTVEKITIVFDYSALTDAQIGDNVNDTCLMYIVDSKGNIVASQTKDFGCDVSELVYANLAQLRFQGGGGRIILGDFAQTMYNNYAIADDGSAIYQYTPGTAFELPSPTKAGFKFAGWYADAEYTQPISAIPSNAAGAYKIYAKWLSLGIDSDPTYAEGGKYFVVNGACYDIDNDGMCDDAACQRCLHKGTLSGTCEKCGHKITVGSCKPANHVDTDENNRCDTCAVLISGHGAPANSGSLGLTAIPSTGDSIGNSGVVIENGDEDYIRTHVMSGGPAINATAGKSIEQLLNESDDMKVTLSLQLGRDSDYIVAGATVRTRSYAMTDHDKNPETAEENKAFTFSFGAIGSDGTFTFAGGSGEGAWDDARTITLLYGTNSFKLTDEIQRLSIVLDFENHTVSYHVDGVLVAVYSNTLVNATYNAETGKYETTTGFKGTASAQALNMRLNNYGVLRVGEVFTVAGDATDLLN